MMLGYIKDDAVAPLEASEKLYPMPMTPIGTYEGVRSYPIKVSGNWNNVSKDVLFVMFRI